MANSKDTGNSDGLSSRTELTAEDSIADGAAKTRSLLGSLAASVIAAIACGSADVAVGDLNSADSATVAIGHEVLEALDVDESRRSAGFLNETITQRVRRVDLRDPRKREWTVDVRERLGQRVETAGLEHVINVREPDPVGRTGLGGAVASDLASKQLRRG